MDGIITVIINCCM